MLQFQALIPDDGGFRTETVLQSGGFQFLAGVHVNGGNVGFAAQQRGLAGSSLGNQADFQRVKGVGPLGQDEVLVALFIDNLVAGNEVRQVEGAGSAGVGVSNQAVGAFLLRWRPGSRSGPWT